MKKATSLLDEASRHQEQGKFVDAERLAREAKGVAAVNIRACAEIDLFLAILHLEEGRTAEGTQELSGMLFAYKDWFKSLEGRDVYERAQLERACSLMRLEKYEEARPVLQEAMHFRLDSEVRSELHCQLGRCYHELSQHALAKEQFESANVLGVSENWLAAFHYCFGYTLYELKEFQQAKREFILCLQSGPSGPVEWMRYAMLAATSRKLGERSDARMYDKKAKSLKPRAL